MIFSDVQDVASQRTLYFCFRVVLLDFDFLLFFGIVLHTMSRPVAAAQCRSFQYQQAHIFADMAVLKLEERTASRPVSEARDRFLPEGALPHRSPVIGDALFSDTLTLQQPLRAPNCRKIAGKELWHAPRVRSSVPP